MVLASDGSEIDLSATTLDFNGALDLDGGTHSLTGTSEIDLTAPTLDFNGAVDISSTLTVHGTLTLADAAGIVYDGETVEIGANDSGGSGFRVLRIPNG
jgi:hypothetical protein